MNATQMMVLLETIKVAVDSILTKDDLKADQTLLATIDKKLTATAFVRKVLYLPKIQRDFLHRLRELYFGSVPVEQVVWGVTNDDGSTDFVEGEIAYARTPLNLENHGPKVSKEDIQTVMETYITDRIDIWGEFREERKRNDAQNSNKTQDELVSHLRNQLTAANKKVGRLQDRLWDARIALLELKMVKGNSDFLDQFREKLSETCFIKADKEHVIFELRQQIQSLETENTVLLSQRSQPVTPLFTKIMKAVDCFGFFNQAPEENTSKRRRLPSPVDCSRD